MLTDAETLQSVLAEVGDTPEGLIAARLDSWWAEFTDLAATPRLRKLAVKVRAADALAADLRTRLSAVLTSDERDTITLKLTALAALRKGAVDELSTERASTSAGTGTAGTLATQRPRASTGEYYRSLDTTWPRY